MTHAIETAGVHRPQMARTLRRYAPLVVLAWLAFLIVSNVITPQLEPVTNDNRVPLVPDDAPSVQALKHIGAAFQESDSNAMVMIIFEGDRKLDEQDHAYYDQLVTALRQDHHVQYVMNLWGEGTTAAGVQSNDGMAAYTLTRVAGDIGSTLNDESIQALRDIIKESNPPPGLHVYTSGSAALSSDMIYVGNTSLETITFVTVILITAMLLLVYRSIITAFMVLFMVLVELYCGRAVAAFLVHHHLIDTSVFAANTLVSLILGAGTDYAIFLVGRYQEARLNGEDKEEAYYSAVSGVSHVILGSGLAIAGATFCMHFARLAYFSTCGIPCAAAMLTAVAIALTFGPAVLTIGSRLGLFEPKPHQAGPGIWRKVGTAVVRWPGRILVAACVIGVVGAVMIPTYKPNYDDRIYMSNDVESNKGYLAADRHFPVSHLNSDMLMVESDHDLRNSTDMIALDRVARAIFHTSGIGGIQSITRPLGRPLEHSSFTYTIGTLGTKIKQVLPFLNDFNDRFLDVSKIIDRWAELTRRQQELTAQQANAADIGAQGAQDLSDTAAALRDNYANFEDMWRPLRNYFYWEPHCFDIPICSSLRSLFDMTDQLQNLADSTDENLKAAQIQQQVTPQLVQVLKQNVDLLDEFKTIFETEHSTLEPVLTQLNELSRQLMDFGTAYENSQNDEFFYLPPDAFANPYFQIDLKYFVSPDGKSARYIVYHDGEALSPEGVQHAETYLPAVKEALKGTTLAGSHVYLGGAAATYWDIQDASKIDLLITATAAFALIFLVMLFITRAVVASLVIVGTVAFSFAGAFGLAILIWQHILGVPLSWWNVTFDFVLLVAVGSDYNLLLVARYLKESEHGLNTGLIRAVAKSGRVVTTAGIVFAVTMTAMLSSDLTSVGAYGSTVGLGLLLDTLIVRSLITPSIARLLGPLFWWPRLIRQRPPRSRWPQPIPAAVPAGPSRTESDTGFDPNVVH